MSIGYYIFQDDKTACGGVVTEGCVDHQHFGRLMACEEHSVTCGKHPGLFKIMGGLPDDFIHGRRVAGTLHSRSTCPCRAEFIPSIFTDTYEFIPEKSEEEKAQEAAAAKAEAERRERLLNPVTPVFAKSCLRGKGCTDAGEATEPHTNFAAMAFFQAVPADDPTADAETPQRAQSTKKKKPDEEIPKPKERSTLYKWLFGSEKERDYQIASAAAASAARVQTATQGASILRPVAGRLTSVGGTWAARAAGVAAGGAGAPLAALVVGMMPGRLNDGEQDFIDRMRAEHMKEAPTRVRYTWETDEYGDLTPHGWHTPPGNDMVRVRKMEWDGSRQAYTFTTEEDEPVTILWTPDSSGVNVPSNTGNQTPPHIPSTIVVDPLPDNTQIDATTSPTPEEKTFADYILILPLPNIPPIYVYLNENKTSFVHGHKHHAPKNKSWKEITESTKSGPAKFKPQTDISAIDHDVWKNGINSTKKPDWKLKEFDEIVGAHGGKETRWVVTKESQGTIHSHPISETDARKLLK